MAQGLAEGLVAAAAQGLVAAAAHAAGNCRTRAETNSHLICSTLLASPPYMGRRLCPTLSDVQSGS